MMHMVRRYLNKCRTLLIHKSYLSLLLPIILGVLFASAVYASDDSVAFEAEAGVYSAHTVPGIDSSAAGNNYIQFTSEGRPAPLNETWSTVFHDDFSNSNASLQEIWELHPPFTTNHPGAVTIADGVMNLRAGDISNYEWTHISTSGPRTTSEPNYPSMKAWQEGYFEARFRYTDSEWSWPAFWIFSASKVEAWPGEHCPSNGGFFNAEWDIVENGVQNGWQHRPAGDWYMTVLHRNTTDNTADGYCATPDQDKQFSKDYTGQTKLSDWHTWGGKWEEDQLCSYLDNQLIHCETAFDTMDQPMVINLNIAYLGDACPSWCTRPKPSQLEMQVDWVRVWQKN